MIAIVFTPEIQKKIHEIVYGSEVETVGTLHTHPHRMRHLSKEDGETIKEALKTSEAFIAGVMLRFGGGIEAYPVYFSRKNPEGKEMLVLFAHPSRRNLFRRKRSR